MPYDLTAFSDYIGMQNQVLTRTLFAGSDTAKFAMFMTGVKGKDRIPTIGGKATIQSGVCKSPNGTTEAGEYYIEVHPWEYFEGFCEDDLQTKFPATMLAPGSNNADAPKAWQEKLVDVKIASLREQLELLYWQGDKASGNTELVLFDGFIKLVDAAGDAINGNVSNATSITKTNVRQLIDDMIRATPTKVKRSADYAVVVGDEVFDLYIEALRDANLYHYSADSDNLSITIPGSNVLLRKIYGLADTSRMFAGRGSHFWIGTDKEGEGELVNVWFDETDDMVYFRTKAKSGVQVTYTDEIVEFTVSA